MDYALLTDSIGLTRQATRTYLRDDEERTGTPSNSSRTAWANYPYSLTENRRVLCGNAVYCNNTTLGQPYPLEARFVGPIDGHAPTITEGNTSSVLNEEDRSRSR